MGTEDSQNCASGPAMDLAWGRVGAKSFQSAWQAGVVSSPFQEAGMRLLPMIWEETGLATTWGVGVPLFGEGDGVGPCGWKA